MIQMQRSLSLPGPAHTSPPTSPTITHLSSRNSSPPPDRHAVPPRLHRYQSKSPTRPPTSYREPVVERERTRNTIRNISPTPISRRQEVAEPLPKPKDVAETPATPTKLPQLPLLQDISQYINPQMSTVAEASATTTLDELAHLVRLSTYQERKRIHSRIRLQRSLVSTALSARLARCGALAHRTLVDNFRVDEKKGFASLYNAIHDVRNSCDALRKYALLEPDMDNGRPNPTDGDDSGSLSTFMHDLPVRSRETFLNFLTQIRTNPDYLASRLTSLTQTELSALTIFHQGLEPVDSVLPFHSNRPKASSTRNSAHIPTAVERLLSFQRHDPLSALIHTCFANSAGPDSVEDRRRTDVWATACARLVKDNRQGTDPFLCNVLNIWVAMRDWSGRSNMEWYLMKILEDGAFLLDKPEDQAGTRIHVEPRSAKDSIAAEDFYDAAVQGLFEIVDDPGAGGIPEGLLELGNAILRKLDPKLHHAVRKFFISKWLFSVFLLNAIIHPETYGMMSEYHISEYGRQKILKEVAMRAQKLVITKLWEPKSSTPPNIKEHIDSIMARFRPTRPSKSNAKLLPARSITSLRETAEVHPYLVLGPADLMAMINALFPDRRPASSSLSKEHFNGLRSGGSSISGISATSRAVPIPAPRGAFDNMSVISNSASSVISEATTSQEPLLNNSSNSNQRFSPASQPYNAQPQRLSYYEDDGFELRMAIHEMTQTLGVDAVSGTCHPCAENWAVLFIAPDGQKLSPQMKHDPDDEAEEEEEYTSSNDSDEDITSARPDLDKDYHQLRDSILKLVEDYEIPQSHDSPQESKTFSNRTSNLESPRRKIRSKPSTASQPQSNNPYRLHQTTSTVEAGKRQDTKTKASNLEGRQPLDSESPPILIAMLEAAEKQCQAQSDFVNAHLYWKTLNQLHQLSSKSLKQDGYASLLSIFSRGPRDIIRRSTSAVEEYDAWLVWLKQSQERHDIIIDSMMKRLKSLRDKMWYVTDVRNSKPYENARSIAVALKWMAAPKKTSKLPLTSMRPRNNSRLSSTNNFLLKSETQILAEIAASEEQGGPNKLSDEQSENTQRWLSQFGIENFCKGEERIHRFCLEIEACINKLVGDNLVDAPDLWSSDLYFRDKRILDSGRQRGDTLLNNFRSLNLSGDDINESETGRRGLRSTDFNRTGSRDLRSMSMRNGSQQSFDSGRYSMSRISTSGDMFDTHDYFGMASPVLTIDSSTTFWSPFQTRTQSPTTSMSSVRPGTSSSTNETVMLREERASLAKQRFITDLKQTLTSLLISDLGTLVFAQGSETDSWFSSDLGQDCMDRKERVERRARKKNKRRTLEKKRSFRDLRSAQITDVPFERPDGICERPDKGASLRPSSEQHTPDVHSIAGSSSTNDTVISGARKAAREADARKNIVKDMESPDFPYRNAFQRLLRMFSVHPNPYAKLNALYELEQLIIAYLTPSNTRRPRLRSDIITSSLPDVHQVSSLAAGDPMPNTPRAKNLEEAIDNCKERRSHTIGVGDNSPSTHRGTDRSINSPTPASTDMIVDTLQELFREADIRPKTLFRDLQFIASFVPAPILDKTERGKAFWDAGLAALGLKQDVCRTMIEVADEIVQHDIKQVERRKTSSVNDALPPVTASSEVLKYGMEDAAKMLTITAKEGEPAAERELGIFYIAHPDLVEKVTAPLSKPRETFKAQVMDMHGGGNASRADPATMCIAFHWMELSAIGGDDLAKRYLRQRESQEINEIP